MPHPIGGERSTGLLVGVECLPKPSHPGFPADHVGADETHKRDVHGHDPGRCRDRPIDAVGVALEESRARCDDDGPAVPAGEVGHLPGLFERNLGIVVTTDGRERPHSPAQRIGGDLRPGRDRIISLVRSSHTTASS